MRWEWNERTVVLVGAVLLACCLACQRGPQLGAVTGTVTWEGKPLANATVSFMPTDGQAAFCRTGEDGTYELQFADGRKGAILGENRVTIETYRIAVDDEGNPIEHPEILPEKFHRQSELTKVVEPGSQVIDFALTSKDE